MVAGWAGQSGVLAPWDVTAVGAPGLRRHLPSTSDLGSNSMNDYKTRQSSLLYVFVRFFGLDRAQNTIVVYSVLRN